MFLPLFTILKIFKYFAKQLKDYNYKILRINKNQRIYIIEDSLLLYIEISNQEFKSHNDEADQFLIEQFQKYNERYKNNKYAGKADFNKLFYTLKIEELTPNTIAFNAKHTKFIHDLEHILGFDYFDPYEVRYTQFKGFYFNINEKDYSKRLPFILNQQFPELKIKERYLSWAGNKYFFIIMKVQHKNGYQSYAVAITTKLLPHSYITQRCKKWILKGYTFNIDFIAENTFIDAFKSWKGYKRQVVLENYFSYSATEYYFKEKSDAQKYAIVLLNEYIQAPLPTDWQSYNRPVNKWVSEEKLFKLVKKFFKGHKVIYQHKPFFLISALGGQMSYDIYVPHLSLAIEYQGKQHFEPVDYFGGIKSFKRGQQRDKLKLQISKKHNITLIYYNYWEDININVLKEKLKTLNIKF